MTINRYSSVKAASLTWQIGALLMRTRQKRDPDNPLPRKMALAPARWTVPHLDQQHDDLVIDLEGRASFFLTRALPKPLDNDLAAPGAFSAREGQQLKVPDPLPRSR